MPIGLRKGIGISALSEGKVEDLGLRGLLLDDESLGETATISSLRYLSLMKSSVSDEGLQNLKQFKELMALDLTRDDVTEAGVAALKNAIPNWPTYYREDVT